MKPEPGPESVPALLTRFRPAGPALLMIFRHLLIIVVAALAFSRAASAAEPAAPVRVMSFNIRFGTARDGDNHWDRRRDFVVETIKAFHPDLLGTQETLGFQRDYLAKALPDFDVLGVGRTDGKEGGEMMALYFRRDRFEKLDGGHFWLSENPEVVGSKSWDSSLPRMVTWVKLRDRKQPGNRPIVSFNTHFDHMGKVARLESARLIRRRLAAEQEGSSLILTGDFNAGEESEPYRALFEENAAMPSPVRDVFRLAHPDRTEEEGTFTGFKASSVRGARIDWIGASRDWKVEESAIDRTSRDGRTPSDHFPVTAVLTR